MASIKIKFRPRPSTYNKDGDIYFQISHERNARQISTEYHILSQEWDSERSHIICSPQSERYAYIQVVKESLKYDLERLKHIIRELEAEEAKYSVIDIVETFQTYKKENSVFNFIEVIITNLQNNGKSRTAETYRSTLNSFRAFRQNKDLMIDALNSKVVEQYQTYLKGRNVVPNTISFYMRILRAIYNRAVGQNLIVQSYPFRHVYTGIDKTIKRALPIEYLRKIKNVDLTNNPNIDHARDMFMISFYLRGMSLIDMAYLKKEDLKDGEIVYRRRKTGQQLIIKWTSEMDAIMRKYEQDTQQYLLPIIPPRCIDVRAAYRNAGFKINYNLKKLAKLLNIPCRITLYIARHSWASVAQANGIPLNIISQGMGHNSETTTKIYLSTLNNSDIDRANLTVINSI